MVLCLALAMLLLHATALGAGGPRVVVIAAGGLSIRDVADPTLPHLSTLLKNGSAALANTRTGRANRLIEAPLGPGMEPECLTLGAGTMAIGGVEARLAANASDASSGVPAGSVYAFRTGRGSGKAEVVHTEIARIQRANAAASYRAVPGTLGSALKAAGIGTAVIGSSDLPGEPHREAAAIAMDQDGLVDRGNVSSADLLVADAEAPYGIRTDPDALLRELDRVLPDCRFVVIDFGDTFRADSYAFACSDAQAALVRKQAVRRLDQFLPRVSSRLDAGKDFLILLSPSSRTFSEITEERLTPIVISGPGFRGGLLTSPSTRREGLVTICDFAPTVLSLLGIAPPSEMAGRPAAPAPRSASVDALLNMNLDASLQGERQPAMRGSSVAQSVVIAGVTLILLLASAPWARRWAAWIALVPALLPLVMLYLPLICPGGLVATSIWLVCLTLLGVALCAAVFRSPMRALVWLCVVLAGSLVVDLARGAPLISTSTAGYSMIEGARYYGIGNELAGTLLGAALIGLGAALSGRRGARRPGLIAAAALGTVFVVTGASRLGANAGATMAAAPAIAVALLARRGSRLTARGMALVLVVSVVIVGALFAIDMVRGGGSQSHIGRAADMAASGGMGLLSVMQRKLAVNFMLVETSVWSRLLVLSIAGSAALYWYGRRRLGPKFLDTELSAGALACCVGTALGFLLNDSGVLAAAASSVFLWMLLALKVWHVRTKD